MHVPSSRLLAALTALAFTAGSGLALAQGLPARNAADTPAVKPVRSIPYVSITGDDGRQRHYETNAIPCCSTAPASAGGMYLGGPTASCR